jgi:hypothetical protein
VCLDLLIVRNIACVLCTTVRLFKAADHIHVGVRTCTVYSGLLLPLHKEWQESLAGTRQTDGKNMVWFGELERKLAKSSKTTFTYRSSS